MSKSKADQSRLDAMSNIPCVCCLSMRVKQPLPTERHHLVDMGNREASGGDQATASLCGWHHQATPILGLTKRAMYNIYGPSMKYQGPPEEGDENKGRFERVFGSQRELLAQTDELLRDQ